MGSVVDDAAFIDDIDILGIHNGADTLGNDDQRGILCVSRQSLAQICVGGKVDSLETIIKEEDLGVDRQSPRNCQTLTLSA